MTQNRDEKELLRLGEHEFEIQAVLDETRLSSTWKAIETSTGASYVIHVPFKPTYDDAKPLYEEHPELFESIFKKDNMLHAKFGNCSPAAIKEIYSSIIDAQVYLYRELLKKLSSESEFPTLYLTTQDQYAWYFVFEYVEGKTLRDYFAENRDLPEEQVLSLLLSISTGLKKVAAAIPENLLYANLKPENIVVDRGGSIHFTDLMNLLLPSDEDSDNDWQLLALPPPPISFKPPEGYADIRSEIYAMGAMLYSCLTGVTVQNSTDRIKKDLLRPLQELAPQYSLKLSKLLSFCLELSPQRRFQTLQQFAAAVAEPAFGTLTLQFYGNQVQSINLGTISSKEKQHTFELDLLKPLELDGVLFIVEKFNAKFSSGAQPVGNIFKLEDPSPIKSGLKLTLTVNLPDHMHAGEYKFDCQIMTTWGNIEFPLSFNLSVTSIFSGRYMGFVYGVLFVLLLLPFRTPVHNISDQFCGIWWNSLKSFSLPESSYSIDLSETSYFQPCYTRTSDATVKQDESGLHILGTGMPRYSSGGVIFKVFASQASDVELSWSMEQLNLAADDSVCKVKLFSSNYSSIQVAFEASGKIVIEAVSDTGTKKATSNLSDISIGDLNSCRFTVKYSMSNYVLTVALNDNIIATFPEMEFDDYAIYIYAAPLKDRGNVNFTIDNCKFVSSPPMVKIFPYNMFSTGKYTLFAKPDVASKYIDTLSDGERVSVSEVREEWALAVTASGSEGWIKKELLRTPLPTDIIKTDN